MPTYNTMVVKCKISDWSCVYHACMSDDCQKRHVIKVDKSLGPGKCNLKPQTMEYTSVKITGINGFEFFVGPTSIWHDNAIDAKKLGIKVELIKTNFRYDEIIKNIDSLEIFEGEINKSKLATEKQVWCLGRHIVNETKNPCFPTEGITIDMCA